MQLGNLPRFLPPPDFGAPPEDPQSRAGSIHENIVSFTGKAAVKVCGIVHHRINNGYPQPGGVFLNKLYFVRMDINTNNLPFVIH